jgi:Protein of unknown function (DUF2569)
MDADLNAGDTPKVKAGLGGWLVLPMIALLVQPIVLLRELYRYFYGFRGPFVPMIKWHAVALDAVVFVPWIAVTLLFFRRRRAAPGAFSLYYVLIYAFWSVVSLFEPGAAHLILTTGLGCCVFVPYLACSRRVQATFTVGPAGGRLERLHERLRRSGKLSILFVVSYVVVLFLLTWAIDALVLGRGW